jgi:hypothetical protein
VWREEIKQLFGLCLFDNSKGKIVFSNPFKEEVWEALIVSLVGDGFLEELRTLAISLG